MLDLPCERCKSRGVNCTEEDKVLTPNRQEKVNKQQAEQLTHHPFETTPDEHAISLPSLQQPPARSSDVDSHPSTTVPSQILSLSVDIADEEAAAPFPVLSWYDCQIEGTTPTNENCTTCERGKMCEFQRWREQFKFPIPYLDSPNEFEPTSTYGLYPPPPWRLLVDLSPSNIFVRLKSSLTSVIENTQTYIQQAWSSINDASIALAKVAFNVNNTERLITATIPLEGELQQIYYYHLSEYFEKLHDLNINGAWDGVGKVWTQFLSKMQCLSSAADGLKLKFHHFSTMS